MRDAGDSHHAVAPPPWLDTWLWALDHDPRIARGSRLAAGPLGGLLYCA